MLTKPDERDRSDSTADRTGLQTPAEGFLIDDNVRVNMTTKAQLMDDLRARLGDQQGFTLATVNLDHIVKLRRSAAFRDAYARQTHVVADGNPIVWMSRLAGRPVELIPGSELLEPLAALANALEVPVALLGATDAVLEAAAARLQAAHPGLKVVARLAPPYGFDPENADANDCIARIEASGARLCFLALGAPKQEILAARAQDTLPACGFVSIGAGLDFIAGTQARAPRWVRRLALEWFWRLAMQPRRLARRYLDCLLVLPGLGLSALLARRSL